MKPMNHATSEPAERPRRNGVFHVEVTPGNVEFQVAGIECAACARRLANHLRRLPGVESALVNPRTGRMRVRFRPSEISAANLAVEVRRAGFVPGAETVHLRVSGMHCAHCAAAIERALREQSGVERVSANAISGDVCVTFVPGEVNRSTIEDLVAGLGYRVGREEQE
jgi:Cu+-exporting ATPase